MSKRKSMLFENKFDNSIPEDKAVLYGVKGNRGARLTIKHLLKLRSIREKRKIRKIQDMKLYTVMYNSGGDDGGGFM